jgi:hypothetical protein
VKKIKLIVLMFLVSAVNIMAVEKPSIELGDWYSIGPFKDEAFGNVIRSLAYPFEPEKDYFSLLGIDLESVYDNDTIVNLALSAKASSPDNIGEDGPRYPQHAIDGEAGTYWDDCDNAKLYVLRLDWEKPIEFNHITISGFAHESFSPKTFTVVADGKVIESVVDGIYYSNQLDVAFPEVTCKQLELKITGYYGGSPAIREVGVFQNSAGYESNDAYYSSSATAINTAKTYRMQQFPGYLELDRQWEKRSDWKDGYYHLLERGPAPSRNESVYLYRSITSEQPQRIGLNFKFMDCYKIWLNGRLVKTNSKPNRYPTVMGAWLDLMPGKNHLLMKNTSRWAEHGFSFAVLGLHQSKDTYYWDIRKHKLDTVDQAMAYLKAFKFSPTPIPMYSPDSYRLDRDLSHYPATATAKAYDEKLSRWKIKTDSLLAMAAKGQADDAQVIDHARRLFGQLQEEVQAIGPFIYIKHPGYSYNAIAPADNGGRRPSSICLYDPATRQETVIFHQEKMAIFDMNLSWDGQSILFSGRDKGDWNIYRIGIDGKGLEQLTDDAFPDISPCQLPDGRIAFISGRRGTYVICQARRAALMYTMAEDGSDVRLISANIDSDHRPQVMNDGRILFTRWDYGIEKNVFARHALWSVNPDGTNMQLVFGNTVEDPGGFWNAKPIPGRPELVSVLGPHHNHHGGMIGLIWNGRGKEAPRGQGYRWITREYPVYGDRHYANGYQDPSVINEKQFLVSYGVPDKEHKLKTGIYYLDVYGNEALVTHDKGGLALYNPIRLVARSRPPVIPPKIDVSPWVFVDPEGANRSNQGIDQTGTLIVQDVYRGISKHVKRGEAKYLAVMEQIQKSRKMAGGEAWGHTPIIGRGTVHARRLIGLVPIEPDGSAHFQVPAYRSLSLNVLNSEGKTLMRMGSDMHVMPGENNSCIGCHEVREGAQAMAPRTSTFPSAAKKQPTIPVAPQSWGTAGIIDYIQVVQPVWDKHCISCHSGPRPDGNVDMTSDRTRFFCQSYEHLVERDIVDHLSVFALDHDEGTPKTTGAIVSTIDEYLNKKHCKSKLTWDERLRIYVWIDANVPYYGTNHYTKVRGVGARDAWEVNNPEVTWSKSVTDTFKRRCMSCHERKVFNPSWWATPGWVTVTSKLWGDKAITSHVSPNRWQPVGTIGPELRMNLTNPDHSLMLQAPLSKDSGGVGLCIGEDGKSIFAGKDDPDYQSMLKSITQGQVRLKETPRVDMLGKDALVDDCRKLEGIVKDYCDNIKVLK